MNIYKDQFTEWSPAYPVFFHNSNCEVGEKDYLAFSFTNDGKSIAMNTLRSHSVVIKAINKAMNK